MQNHSKLIKKILFFINKIRSSPISVRLIKNFGASSFGQLVTVAIQIVSVPIFLMHWGVSLYGEWLILSSISTYLTMSDIGFANVAANEMTILVAKGDRKNALDVFQSTWLFISGVSLIVSCFICLAVWIFPIESWLHIHLQSHNETAAIICILTLNVWVNLQSGLVSAGYRCEGMQARSIFLYNLQRLISFCILSLAVIGGANPFFCALSLFLASVICVTCLSIDLRRSHAWIAYGYKNASMKTLKRLIIPAIAFMSFPLGNALSLQGMITVIGIVLGSRAVVVFSTLRTLTRFAWQMINMINNTVWPELSIAFGENNYPLLRKLHRRSCQASMYLSTGIVILLACTGNLILHFWTKGQVNSGSSLLYIFLLNVITSSFWSTSSIVPLSLNLHRSISLIYLLSTIFSLAISIILMNVWGLEGAAISTIIPDVIMIFFVIKTSLKLTKDNFSNFMLALIHR